MRRHGWRNVSLPIGDRARISAVGLAFVLPWLGYSTWHLYTRLIDREALQTRR